MRVRSRKSEVRPSVAQLTGLSAAEIEAAMIAECELGGACAAVLGRRADENPYPKGSARRRAWARGLRGQAVRELKNALGDETVRPKNTFHVEQRPGRGRGKLGQRSEWTPRQKAAALAVRHQLSNRWIGRLLGRTHEAVRNQFHRMDKEGKANAGRTAIPGL